MDINTLRDEMVKAVKEKKFKPWNVEQRYLNLVRQVGGFGEALQYHLDLGPAKKKCENCQHDTVQHQIACIMIDLFMLSDMLDADLEKELLAAIQWFKIGKK